MKRLRELEEENGRLKPIVADLGQLISDPNRACEPPLDVEPERNHIRNKLSACEKFNSLLGLLFRSRTSDS